MPDPSVETSPVIEWHPMLVPEGVTFTPTRFEEAIPAAKQMIDHGYKYLSRLVGPEVPISRNLRVALNHGTNHRAEGSLMFLSAHRILEAHEPEAPRYLRDREQSLVLHELVHTQVDEVEDLPMMAELIYMLERQHPEIIDKLIQAIHQDKLPLAYMKGLTKIVTRLGESDLGHFLHSLPDRNIDQLKGEFRQWFIERTAESTE